MPNHEVAQGECLSSISAKYGFLWSTIWNHGDNAALKNQRKDPNVLLPGDVVVIPDIHIKEESRASDASYTFKMKGTPVKIKIRILEDDEPRKNVPYKLEIDGKQVADGKTDGQGFVKASVPAHAVRGILKLGDASDLHVYYLALGTLDPWDTQSGAEQRLKGLGYHVNTEEEDGFKNALKLFQEKEKLNTSGELDDSTKSKLQERYGQ